MLYVMETTKKRPREKPVFARNVVSLRKAKGWSQHRLAEESGVAHPTIRDIEAGISGGWPKTRMAIAKALGVAESVLHMENPTAPVTETKDQLVGQLIRLLPALDERQLRAILNMVEAAADRDA